MEIIRITKEESTRLINLCNKASYLNVRFKEQRGKAYIKVSTRIEGKKYVAECWADDELLKVVMDALNDNDVNLETYLKNEHTAVESKGLEFRLFKDDVENLSDMTFTNDYISPSGFDYICAHTTYPKGRVFYCLKRTVEVENYLEDNGLF
ncbi:hypothetical protein CE91St9_03220 [Bacteroides thetaiotaomicron]|uniref:hypothetical protein n=1 Tax=Bacteroides thetaiotaomicron TaxID=818 RepID=UPI001FBAC40C|nr:hypothetical protein [Bacteroides thetaiotaomicron]GKH18598.1 hypothetical protein CE91St8_03330 [Bacteroides thetaiotaomicron]GKH65649.1 hypothetical protein CE91St9_03220 [Bacteroides thetaiotaomicron]